MWSSNYKKSTYKLNYVGKLEKHTPKPTNDPPAPYPPACHSLVPMITMIEEERKKERIWLEYT